MCLSLLSSWILTKTNLWGFACGSHMRCNTRLPCMRFLYKIVSDGEWPGWCFLRDFGVVGLEPPPLEKLNSSASIIVSCPIFMAPFAFRCPVKEVEWIPWGTSSFPWCTFRGEPISFTSLAAFRSIMGDLSTRFSRFWYVTALAFLASCLLLNSSL